MKLLSILLLGVLVGAQTVTYKETWDNSTSGWTFTQAQCSGKHQACASGLSTNGNPPDSLFVSESGNDFVGTFEKTITWEQMGVPEGSEITNISTSIDYRCVGECTYFAQTIMLMQGNELCTTNTPELFVYNKPMDWMTEPNLNSNYGVASICSASSTPITIQLYGETSSQKHTEVDIDNLVVTISYQ